MITISLILLILGLVFGVGFLIALGIAGVLIGLVLNVVPVRGQRRRYY